MSERTPAINLSNFSFRYGTAEPFAIRDINFRIDKGEIVLLGGISGSGKSTLSNAISGRIPFTVKGQMKGKIELLGKDIWEYKPEELSRSISFVFQNADEQLVTFNVFDEIAFAPENLCMDTDEINKRVEDAATALDINDLLTRSIYSLSGGEKQKVVLAANLVMMPQILILDEPLAFLDDSGEVLLVKQLRSLHQQNPEMTIVIIEHRLKPFLSLANRIMILNEMGVINFDGNNQEYSRFVNETGKCYFRDELIRDDQIKQQKASITPSHKGIAAESPLIRLENISYAYPNSEKNVFDNLSLDIYEGDFIGLVGPNGCGKTTLLYLLAKVFDPDLGRILYGGQNYEAIDKKSFIPKIGFIFQNPESQIFETTVRDEILFAVRNFWGFERLKNFEEKEQIITELIPLIGEYRKSTTNIQEKNPFSLSWGQKRRLNLASIFSYEPELLFIDEPFIGQDAASIKRIFEILHAYHEAGKTIIIISHDKPLLYANCNKIVDLSEINNSVGEVREDTGGHDSKDDEISSSPTNSKAKRTVKKKKNRKIAQMITLLNPTHPDREELSWLQRTNPIAKLLMLILLVVSIFLQKSITVLIICFFFLVVIAWSAGISPKLFLKRIRIVVILTIIYILLNTLFDAQASDSDVVLFYLFGDNFPVRRLALYYAVKTGFLIINLFSSSMLFTQTTALKDLEYSLIQMGIPYRYAFSFMIGLRYIPLIENESNTIEIAQELRGAGIRKGSSVKKIYHHILHRITTLLVSILRKIKTTAATIEARGFGCFDKRTSLYKVKWHSIDFYFFLISIVLFVALILISMGAWLIPIPALSQVFFA